MAEAYLDHNATSRCSDAATRALREVLAQPSGHPSAFHRPGRAFRQHVEAARQAVGRLLGCGPDQVLLTSGGTEGNVTVVHDAVLSASRVPHLVLGATEHPSLLAVAHAHAAAGRCRVSLAPVDAHGRLELDALRHLLPHADALFAMAVNNETGVVTDLDAVASLTREHGVPWHCDAVQALDRLDATRLRPVLEHAATITLSGHKLGGPQGTGALFCRTPLTVPLLPGTAEQRAGTPATLLFAGLAAALDELSPHMEPHARTRLEQRLRARWPGVVIHGQQAPRVCNTVYFSLPDPEGTWVDGHELVAELALRDVAASTGAACTTADRRPSHVLTAMGVPPDVASASVRLSWHPGDDLDVDGTLQALEASVAEL
jgi:cysteine desulfurase